MVQSGRPAATAAMATHAGPGLIASGSTVSEHHHLFHGPQQHHHVQPLGSTTTISTTLSTFDDSDFEIEAEAKDWRLNVTQEVLGKLSKKEAKRQDVINGEKERKKKKREQDQN
jgi:hypothetical protein